MTDEKTESQKAVKGSLAGAAIDGVANNPQIRMNEILGRRPFDILMSLGL